MAEDKQEEILDEIPFLTDNEKWSGSIQIIKVTMTPPVGSNRTYINKRLTLKEFGRYIPLPRFGCEQIIAAIQKASEVEQKILTELSVQRPPSEKFEQRQGFNRKPKQLASKYEGDDR